MSGAVRTRSSKLPTSVVTATSPNARNVSGTTALSLASNASATFVDTLTGDTTYSAPSSLPAGRELTIDLFLAQDATGGHALTWFSGIKWANGQAPTMPSGASATMIVTLISPDGGTTWYGSYSGATSGSGILGSASYNPGTASVYTGPPTALGDVDATNLAVTFTAPASGRVLVTLNACLYVASVVTYYWGVREGTTNLQQSSAYIIIGGTLFNIIPAIERKFLITGVSAGSHTYKWAHAVSAASASTGMYAGGTQGAAVMTLEAA